MALHTKSGFAQVCGVQTSYITTYIKRGKIVLNKEDYIDDTVEPNKSWMEKQLLKVKTVPETTSTPTETPSSSNETVSHSAKNMKELEEIELKKKRVDLRKAEESADIERIKKEKLQGLLIPTDLVRSLFTDFSKNISNSFKDASDNLMTEFAQKHNLTHEELTSMRGRLLQTVNSAIKSSVEGTKKGIQNIVDEYSETRGRGEKK